MPYRQLPTVRPRRWLGRRWQTPRGCIGMAAVMLVPLCLAAGAWVGHTLTAVFGTPQLVTYAATIAGALVAFITLLATIELVLDGIDRLAAFGGRLELTSEAVRVRPPGLSPRELSFAVDSSLRIRCAVYPSPQLGSEQTYLLLERPGATALLRAEGALSPIHKDGRQLTVRRGRSLDELPDAIPVEIELVAIEELLLTVADTLDRAAPPGAP